MRTAIVSAFFFLGMYGTAMGQTPNPAPAVVTYPTKAELAVMSPDEKKAAFAKYKAYRKQREANWGCRDLRGCPPPVNEPGRKTSAPPIGGSTPIGSPYGM